MSEFGAPVKNRQPKPIVWCLRKVNCSFHITVKNDHKHNGDVVGVGEWERKWNNKNEIEKRFNKKKKIETLYKMINVIIQSTLYDDS